MKLFEIKQDINSYQVGDDRNPRSPYYKEPTIGNATELLPIISVYPKSGTTDEGEQYTVVEESRWLNKEQQQLLEYTTDMWSNFPQYEFIGDSVNEDGETGQYFAYFIGATTQDNNPQQIKKVASQVVKAAEEAMLVQAEKMLSKKQSMSNKQYMEPDDDMDDRF